MWVIVGRHSKKCTEPSDFCYDLEQYQSNQKIQVTEPELNLNLLGSLPSGRAVIRGLATRLAWGCC